MRFSHIGGLVAVSLAGADAFASSSTLLGNHHTCRVLKAPMPLSPPRGRALAPSSQRTRMQLNSGGGGDAGNKQGLFTVDTLAKPTVVLAWILYMQHIFLRFACSSCFNFLEFSVSTPDLTSLSSDAPCGAAGGEMCGITLPVINVWNDTAGLHV